MSDAAEAGPTAWDDALRALALFAVDPAGVCGVALRSPAGAVRDIWLDGLALCLPLPGALRKMPANIGDDRLLGGLDLTATLQAGRPVAAHGFLADADGGVVLLAMAERLPAGTAARLGAVLDAGAVTSARHGVTESRDCRIGVVALDEGIDDEALSPALLDRLALPLDLTGTFHRDVRGAVPDRALLAEARGRLGMVRAGPDILEALCSTASALGIGSLRAPFLALKVARAACALEGRETVSMQDAALAARLVLAPRARILPAAPAEDEAPADPPPPDDRPDESERPDDDESFESETADMVLAAARAAIPAGLLARLAGRDPRAPASSQAGRAGERQNFGQRGRPAGVRAEMPRAGVRLNLIETLRAAAPWQTVRTGGQAGVIKLRREDFRITRLEQRRATTTIFVVDASGSSALNRLAEAKGAVELLLADCYQRRDQVAVLAFRSKDANMLLPPTRSLVRAKRSLATLPGGGGTPLAAGIEAGFLLAESVRRGGGSPTIVLLTDGRANVARDGRGGRPAAEQDAAAAARRVRAAGFSALLIDTSPRPYKQAEVLAADMGALYIPLPFADARSLSRTVRAAGEARR